MGEIKVIKTNLDGFKYYALYENIIDKKLCEYNINTNKLGEALQQLINDHFKDYVIPEIYGFSYINKKYTDHIVIGRILSIDVVDAVEKSSETDITNIDDGYYIIQYPINIIFIVEIYCDVEYFNPLCDITSDYISLSTATFIRRKEYEKLRRLYKK